MKRTITVLQDDIDQGCEMVAHNCPIARAMMRDLADIMSENRRPCVGKVAFSIREHDGNRVLHGLLPLEATLFINNFDGGRPVEPFKFEVELTEEEGWIRLD